MDRRTVSMVVLLVLSCTGDVQTPTTTTTTTDPGSVVVHRLNKAEYNNTVRDLLHTTQRPADSFPDDDSSHGFDNIAEVLSTSPLHVELYDAAATNLATEALVEAVSEPELILIPGSDIDEATNGSASNGGWTLWSNGTADAFIDVPGEGLYVIRAWLSGQQAGDEPVQASLWVDGAELGVFDVPNSVDDGAMSVSAERTLTAGSHTVSVAFLNDYWDPSEGEDRNLVLELFEVEGPLNAEAVPNQTRAEILTCEPTAGDVSACAREVVAAFGLRAWRRPLDTEEIDQFVSFIQGVVDDGNTFDLGVELVVRAMLASPHFLFQVETDPVPGSTEPHPLNDHELASRMSYFLWSSMPDQELFELAAAGELTNPDVLEAQTLRMLADEKAVALTDNFGGQWLFIRAVDQLDPDPWFYPDWDPDLKSAAKKEMQEFFEGFVNGDASMRELLTAKSGPINWRLAQHYGVEERFFSDEMWNEHLEPIGRGGWLTTTGFLTATSYPTRTSPVRRGKWVLTQLLCDEPPPPPPGVEGLPQSEETETITLREQLEAHRADPMCASCHETMDELGFGLEHFDGIGAFRDEDGGQLIDANGALPDGRAFYGARELADVVAADPQYAACVSRQLFTYGLGREPKSGDDRVALEQITSEFVAADMRFRDLVVAIVRSDPFRMRRSSDGGAP